MSRLHATRWRGKRKTGLAEIIALPALLCVEHEEAIAGRIISDIERRHERGSRGFYRAVRAVAVRSAPELRKALFAVMVTT